jgi:hypothetical protein
VPHGAVAVDAHRAEVGAAGPAELAERRQRLRPREHHRVEQVVPAALVGQHVGDEVALGDLQAHLVLLQVRPLLVDLGARRQPGRRVHELGDAQRPPEAVGELLVDVHAPATFVSRPSQ